MTIAVTDRINERDLPALLRDGPYLREGDHTRLIMRIAADAIEQLRARIGAMEDPDDAEVLDLAIAHENGGAAGGGEPREHWFTDQQLVAFARELLARRSNVAQIIPVEANPDPRGDGGGLCIDSRCVYTDAHAVPAGLAGGQAPARPAGDQLDAGGEAC